MKIVLDAYGGDKPSELLKGAADAITAFADLELIITGDEAKINAELAGYKFDRARVEIVHAPDIITNYDVPTDAIRKKKDSSMVRAFDECSRRADVVGMVTTGSTGAALSGGTFKFGRIQGVRRLALCPTLPTVKGGDTCLIDCGANVDCKPEFLAQFALMGAAYMRAVYGIDNPTVALVSNGVEDKKGNELVQAAFPLLKALPINFVGNMETKEALSGEYDVLVCDGFVGNVLLKAVEGSVSSLMKMMKKAMMSSLRSKIGGALVKPALKKMMRALGEDERGGAAFLGCNKLLVKAHGGSDAPAVKAALRQVLKMAQGDLVGKLAAEFASLSGNI
jgi:glycerol-3-phosphate acyltransferase PlsX